MSSSGELARSSRIDTFRSKEEVGVEGPLKTSWVRFRRADLDFRGGGIVVTARRAATAGGIPACGLSFSRFR